MGRRNRRDVPPARAFGGAGAQRTEMWRGADYVVRSVTGQSATKDYRCPGCDQLILAGRPHVVTWPAADPDADDRRHWHTACWAARNQRAPGVQRGRNAPRH
ncbi:ATP/GTP-binding protein [uncultured Jatrophihabitans sp.]|uniref:ATP/GTP-binding protein n=1 Tax=uncultured Jatrophihabitans sp. TaxID=1610747 RepID=UPI0035CBF08F